MNLQEVGGREEYDKDILFLFKKNSRKFKTNIARGKCQDVGSHSTLYRGLGHANAKTMTKGVTQEVPTSSFWLQESKIL